MTIDPAAVLAVISEQANRIVALEYEVQMLRAAANESAADVEGAAP